MVGARELPLGEAPALHASVAALAELAGLPKPRLYVLPDGLPRALAAGRGPRGGGDRGQPRPAGGRTAGRARRRPRARARAHPQPRRARADGSAVVVAAALIETSRIGGWLQRALLFVLGPLAAAIVHLLLSPKREFAADRAAAGSLRLAARPGRRADPARAGRRARRVPGEPGDRAALHDQPVRRGGPCGAVRDAPAGRRARPPAAGARPRLAREAARGLERRRGRSRRLFVMKYRRRPTLPGGCPPSTIGAGGLNFSVRNGKRCTPAAITAEIVKGARKAHPQNSIAATTCSKSRPRAISTGPLNALLRLHVPPINVVVSHGPYSLEGDGKPHLEVGFPLRCFQRLSHPDVANQQRRWHDD